MTLLDGYKKVYKHFRWAAFESNKSILVQSVY
jgi:hypothetical protein